MRLMLLDHTIGITVKSRLNTAVAINACPNRERSWSQILPLSVLFVFLITCSALPSKYIERAEPGVTLTALTASPQQFRDKIVILGGVLVKEREEAGRVWLHLKNRHWITTTSPIGPPRLMDLKQATSGSPLRTMSSCRRDIARGRA
jgi:hypothetical protein